MSHHQLSVGDAHSLVVRALVASNTSERNARSVAAALVGAELSGQSGHGLRRVAAYAAQARAGKVNGHAVPTAEKTRPGAVLVDARNGFAYPALDLAVSEMRSIAPRQGIAVAGIRRSHHAGVAGLTVERLAEAGLVALLFSNTPAAMAPAGARRALFGTNPIAFACPGMEEGPVVIDLSLSKVARGRIMAAAQKGERIPEGWALDAEGRPTTEAKSGLAGSMVPLGDAKGAALALMVEMLAAGLTGANYAYEQSSFFDDKGAPPGTGQSIIAIDAQAFGQARFESLIAALIHTEGARVPGQRRRELRWRMERDGIPVEPSVIDEIRTIGAAGAKET